MNKKRFVVIIPMFLILLSMLFSPIFVEASSKNIEKKDKSIEILDINKRLINKHIIVELTDNCKNIIIEEAYNPIYGARPLKRYLSKNI